MKKVLLEEPKVIKAYGGKHIALKSFADGEIVGCGKHPKKKGFADPVLFYVPKEGERFF